MKVQSRKKVQSRNESPNRSGKIKVQIKIGEK
jgi:hypothetical protein